MDISGGGGRDSVRTSSRWEPTSRGLRRTPENSLGRTASPRGQPTHPGLCAPLRGLGGGGVPMPTPQPRGGQGRRTRKRLLGG